MPCWAAALLVTLAIEVPVVAALFKGQRRRMALVALVVNCATNPFLNLVLATAPGIAGRHVLPGEILAVVVEAAVYAWLSRPRDVARAILAAAMANLLSFAAGYTALPVWLCR